MATKPSTVTITQDNVSKVFKSMAELTGKQVLIGIPDTGQNNRDEGPVNNATIGYTMEFGSPAQNIPARAHLIPGVQAAEKPALFQLRKAADAALVGDGALADRFMNYAGILAANEVKHQINSNIPPPLAPGTIRGRKYARGTASRRESEQVYLELINKGVDPRAAQDETGIIALVNTGQYRNAITYVVRKRNAAA
jgi:hypothetical protein